MTNKIQEQLHLILDQTQTYEEQAEFLRMAVSIGITYLKLIQEENPEEDVFVEYFEDSVDPSIHYQLTIQPVQMEYTLQ